MGKTTDLLKKVEQDRLNKYTFAIKGIVPVRAISEPEPRGLSLNLGVGKTGVYVLIAILLIFNLALLFTVITVFAQKNDTVAKLSSISPSGMFRGVSVSSRPSTSG